MLHATAPSIPDVHGQVRGVGCAVCRGHRGPFPLAGQAQNSDNGTNAPTRPSIMFNRWEEDWSVLADPRVPREPFDSLKYIPLSVYDPKTYLSFGANLRERFEGQDAANFGIGTNRNQNYVISRSEAHADLRIADQLQVFVQLQSDFAPLEARTDPGRPGQSRS